MKLNNMKIRGTSISDADGKNDIDFKWQLITPDIATEWLKKNKDNRNVSEACVKRYMRAMERGEWQLNGDTIRFDEDGFLLDGQHRLIAVTRPGISIYAAVIYGLPRTVFSTMDIGRHRKTSDILSIKGYSNSLQLNAALNVLWEYENSKFQRLTKGNDSSSSQIIELLENNQDITESVMLFNRLRQYQVLLSPSIGAALHYIFSKERAGAAEHFFDSLYKGINLSPDSPILHLRNLLINDRINRVHRTFKYSIIAVIKAWNAYINNKAMGHIKVMASEEVPDISWGKKDELSLSA